MTPKEKAKELVWKYLPILELWKENNSNKAKECALIAVDEIRSNCEWNTRLYWLEVKQEIEKL